MRQTTSLAAGFWRQTTSLAARVRIGVRPLRWQPGYGLASYLFVGCLISTVKQFEEVLRIWRGRYSKRASGGSLALEGSTSASSEFELVEVDQERGVRRAKEAPLPRTVRKASALLLRPARTPRTMLVPDGPPPGYDALEGEFIFLEDTPREFGEYYVCGVLRGGPDRAAGSSAICLSTSYPDGEEFLWVECELVAGAYRVAIGNGAGRQPPAIPPILGEIS